MKVLLITAYFKEKKRSIPASFKLASLLSRFRIKVVVFTSKAISKREYKEGEFLKVYESKDIFIKDPLNINIMPFLYRDLKTVLRKEDPDVCIVSKYIFFPIWSVPLLKARKKKVIVLTDTYPGIVWFTRSSLINFLAKVYTLTVGKILLRMADAVVLTHEELVPATKRLGVRNFRVIHTGIDLAGIRKAVPAKDIRKGKDEVIIAFVGRLASIKGVDIFLEAAARVLPKHGNVRFLLIGDGDRSGLMKHKRIEYLGFRDDVPSVMKRCDMMVMPSFSEGLPAAVIEAMALGLPVIGSDIPGGMRVLIKDGITGLTFRKGDSADLAEKIESLLKSRSQRERLGKGALAHVMEDFNSDVVIGQWKDLFSELQDVRD
jgi:glycosyltransferase involved in cell wall biosynthesis